MTLHTSYLISEKFKRIKGAIPNRTLCVFIERRKKSCKEIILRVALDLAEVSSVNSHKVESIKTVPDVFTKKIISAMADLFEYNLLSRTF